MKPPIALLFCGIILAIDGIASLIAFMDQNWFYQSIRVLRLFIGLYLVIYSRRNL
ncbi:MAG: hypothetical protein Q8P59_05760 [Dehalococcoidia bacterium]|nr:hypothetical protein [Dehalococcoidia bacterium]